MDVDASYVDYDLDTVII